MSAQREDWTGKDTAQCVGMLVMTPLALLACTGHLSADAIRAYAQAAVDLAVPVAAGVGAAVAVLGVVLVVLRHLRAALLGMVRAYWLYRRRWAAVLEGLGLTVAREGRVVVPRVVSVHRVGDEDVVGVRLVPGQGAVAFHEASAALAHEFGARSAVVRLGEIAHRDITITFDRRPTPRRAPLALPAPVAPVVAIPLPGAASVQQPRLHRPGPALGIRLTGIRLQIVWASVQRTGHDGSRVRLPLSQRYGLRGELRWSTWQMAN